jgi:uncharacterized membrane protein YhhN
LFKPPRIYFSNCLKTLRAHFTVLYIAISVSYLVLLPMTNYALHFFHKALPILMLIALFHIMQFQRNPSVLLAILFSAAGDILLALDIPNSFTLGLGSFFIAQLCYTKMLFGWRSWSTWKLFPLGLLIAFVGLCCWLIIPQSGEMKIPIVIYMLALSAMAISAIAASRPFDKLILGAALFVISDALIAINKFVFALPLQNYLIMSSYYMAQFLLITSVSKRINFDKGR